MRRSSCQAVRASARSFGEELLRPLQAVLSEGRRSWGTSGQAERNFSFYELPVSLLRHPT